MAATLSFPSITVSRKCVCSSVCEEMPSGEIDFLFKDGTVVRDSAGEMPYTSVAVMHNSRNNPEKLLSLVNVQLSALRERLKNWCEMHVARVDTACLVPYRIPYEFCFVVKVRDNHYDIDFADALSKLEMDIADDECFGVVTMKVMDLPKVSEGRFVQMARLLERFT